VDITRRHADAASPTATNSCPVRSRRSQFQACPRSPACR